ESYDKIWLESGRSRGGNRAFASTILKEFTSGKVTFVCEDSADTAERIINHDRVQSHTKNT
ncbi:hypothetical protein DVA76_18300, partial [Acinetobacter baumannii]